MTRPNPYIQLTDRDSAIVRDALTRRCEICKAKPGDDCIDTLAVGPAGYMKPLRGRLVHYARTSP